MIQFHCEYCGQKFKVTQDSAGKKGRCPKCKNVIVVPKVENATPVANQPVADASEISLRNSILDSRLFEDIPKENASDKDKALDDLRKLHADKIKPEPLPERKLPWLVDIFLYPSSKAGLTMLGIFIGVPLLIEIFTRVLNLVASQFPPFIVFTAFFLSIGLIIKIVIILYRYWYITECIRDSADGQIRAPETLAATPGGEIFSSFLKIFVCVIIFSAPIYSYLFESKGIEKNFWPLFHFTLFFPRIVASEVGKGGITFHLLLFLVVFFFPITVTSVIMSDSFRGLNPILIVRSIFKTFVPYCGLILLLYILWVPIMLIREFILNEAFLERVGLFIYLPKAVYIYLLLVAAHLLGRFYWKYEEKLDWNV
jgi:DNA-directed RNA polymerase subunit RPC12/RpoP